MQTYQKKAKPSARTMPRSRPAAARAPQQGPLRGVSDLSPVERAGRPVDLPAAIQSKMESAFGADLSGVKLYESQAVADAGADALAQGSHIAFAPGQLDLVSMRGQALLGHELSHVVSQARGEARGSGLLENHVLEARADREGRMAAMGQSIYPSAGATPGAAAAVAAAGAAGPVQAKWSNPFKRRRPAAPAPAQTQAPAPAPSPAPERVDSRLGASNIEADSLGGNALDAGLAATDQFNDFSSTVETLASTWDDESAVLGRFGEKAGAVNDSAFMGHAAAIGSMIGTAKNTVDTARDIKDTVTDQYAGAAEKAASVTGSVASWGSDALGTAKNLTGQIIQNEAVQDAVGSQLEAHGSYFQMVAGTAGAAKAAIHGHEATGDRLAAERAGRMIASDSAQRAASGDAEKIKNDKLLRSMATNARNAAKVRKAESVQEGVNAGMDIVNGGLGLIPGVGNLAAMGGSAVKAIVNAGMEAHVDQKRKEAREKNLDNQSLRASLEKKLGMRDDLPEKKKNEIRHRAKHIANQITSGERGATTNKVAGMHKTQNDVTALNTLSSQDSDEGRRARGIVNAMGIGTDAQGGMLDTDAAAAQVNADFARGGSVEEQIGAADAHQFEKEHTVQAELKRQQAAAEAKKQKKADKQAQEQKEQAARTRFNSLSEGERQRIRADNERHSAEKSRSIDEGIKNQNLKWYEFRKKRQARKVLDLEYDIQHQFGDEFGGHDVSEKQAKLDAIREQMAAKQNAKENRKHLKAARKEARKEDKAYKNHRDEQRKLAGIKWYEFKKKKEFNNEYDYATGTKERPDAKNDKPWYQRAGDHVKDKWYSMRRKHQRARDSFVNEEEDFKQLSGWRKAKLVIQNPLAFLKSKTKKGRAATAKRNAEAAADSQMLEQLMNNPDSVGEDGSVSLPHNSNVSADALQAAKANLKPVDASQLSTSNKRRRITTGTHAIDEIRQAREQAESSATPEQAPPEAAPSDASEQYDPHMMSVSAKVKRYNTPDGVKAPVREEELAPWYRKKTKK